MKVSECMTRDVWIVDPDQTLRDAAHMVADIDAGRLPVGARDRMADIQVRRLPVLDQDKKLVGIVSIIDLAGTGEAAHAGEALRDIARPSGLHSQAG